MASERKETIYKVCQKHIKTKLDEVHAELEKIKAALLSETKSTAGDKHETGRAMLQLERERLGNQLLQLEKTQQVLNKTPWQNTSETVAIGSLIQTEKVEFFLSVPIGKIEIDEKQTFCISAQSPVGQQLLGKQVGETIYFNGQTLPIHHLE